MRLKNIITYFLFLVCMLCFAFFVQAKSVWYEMDVEARSAPVIITGEVKDTNITKLPSGGSKIEAKVLVKEVIKNEDETYDPFDPSKITRVEPKQEIKNGSLIPVRIENFHEAGSIYFEKGELVLLPLMPRGTSEKSIGYFYRLFGRNAKHSAKNKEELNELAAQTKYFLSERVRNFDSKIRFRGLLIKEKHLWTVSDQGIFVFDKETGNVAYHYTPITDFINPYTKEPYYWYQSLVLDNIGNIWLGSTTGLAKFNGEHWEVFRPAEGELKGILDIAAEKGDSYKPYLAIQDIFVADNGVVWCNRGYSKNFTFDEKSGKWESVETPWDNLSPKPKIEGPFILDNGAVERIGGNKFTLLKWQENCYKLSSLASEVYIGEPYTLVSDGSLWVTLWKQNFHRRKFIALARYNIHRDTDWKMYSWKDGFPEKDISCLTVDSDGTLYIGGERGSLFKFDGKNFTPIPTIRDGKSILEE